MPLPKVLPQVQNGRPATGGPAAAKPPDGRGGAGAFGQGSDNRTPGGGGKVVANRYSVERRLGSGAFGTAFLVSDKRSANDR